MNITSLFNNEKYADITFTYGPNCTLCLNKAILAVNSEYYNALFYGPLSTKETRIEKAIDDLEADHAIFRHMYGLAAIFETETMKCKRLEFLLKLYKEVDRIMYESFRIEINDMVYDDLDVNTDVEIVIGFVNSGCNLMKFFVKCFPGLSKNPTYVTFFKENSDILFDIADGLSNSSSTGNSIRLNCFYNSDSD